MAKALNWNYAYNDADTKNVSIYDVNWNADFALQSDEPGDCVVVNTTGFTDHPETVRFAINDVANAYTGTGVDPANMAPNKQGFSLLVQTNDLLRVTDSENPTYQKDLPVSCHIVVKSVRDSDLTPDAVEFAIKRMIAALYNTDVTDSSRINELLRKALKPANV